MTEKEIDEWRSDWLLNYSEPEDAQDHQNIREMNEIFDLALSALRPAKPQVTNGLLSCPFCGGDASFGECHTTKPITYFVNCVECLASTNQLSPCIGLPKEEAARDWNQRV